MESITNIFKSSTSLNIVFFILTVVGVILAVIFYYKSVRIKRPVYSTQTFRLIDKKITTIKDIEIKYNKLEVDNLSLTKIAFWNSGKESIRKADIASTDLLRIVATENTTIYDCVITFQNDVNNIVVLKEGVKSINISFEFLDFNEGFVLNVYHSGNNSDDLIIKGTLIGAKKISQGVKYDHFAKKIDYIRLPFINLMYSKVIPIRILGWLLVLPYMMVALPFYIVITPIDVINDKIINKAPKEFYLFDQ